MKIGRVFRMHKVPWQGFTNKGHFVKAGDWLRVEKKEYLISTPEEWAKFAQRYLTKEDK